MFILDINKKYTRYNNILYEDDEPIFEFLPPIKFIDIGPRVYNNPNIKIFDYLSKDAIMYMERFIRLYPNKVKKIEEDNSQIIMQWIS